MKNNKSGITVWQSRVAHGEYVPGGRSEDLTGALWIGSWLALTRAFSSP